MDYLGLFLIIFGLSHDVPALNPVMIFGALDIIYLTFAIGVLLLLWGRTPERKAFAVVIFSLPIAIILIKVLHLFYLEPRPFVVYHLTPLINHPQDPSFPSTHTTIASIMAFSYLFYKSKWAPLFVFFLLWIGFSRIYVGVHYPIDILGGVLTGLAAVSIIWLFKKRIFS